MGAAAPHRYRIKAGNHRPCWGCPGAVHPVLQSPALGSQPPSSPSRGTTWEWSSRHFPNRLVPWDHLGETLPLSGTAVGAPRPETAMGTCLDPPHTGHMSLTTLWLGCRTQQAQDEVASTCCCQQEPASKDTPSGLPKDDCVPIPMPAALLFPGKMPIVNL
ncbi:uncharacterized protein LOC113970660 isoform X2 [Neopelma chrysocephalum]|uniref:uncharacterized protein LOC113970660 isoform X2 n=1 Tax=Neopelma chrysocephalum TaxID=114329 RepID=UPI000FCD035D|nr:uncharacterized protein LOC113970660 isoform X2 [Neopelma chrysocephalum]